MGRRAGRWLSVCLLAATMSGCGHQSSPVGSVAPIGTGIGFAGDAIQPLDPDAAFLKSINIPTARQRVGNVDIYSCVVFQGGRDTFDTLEKHFSRKPWTCAEAHNFGF